MLRAIANGGATALVLVFLTVLPVRALSGEECLAVSQRGDLGQVQSMLSQHTIDQLFKVRDGAGRGLLHFCIRRDSGLWRALLDAGWPVARETGWTPQHEAALIGNKEAVLALSRAGADMSCHEPLNGGTPLHVAAFNGHLEVVKALLAAGVDVNSRDNEGWTALSQARDQGFPAIVDWLKQNGATR